LILTVLELDAKIHTRICLKTNAIQNKKLIFK
jgi:hypothetical protein